MAVSKRSLHAVGWVDPTVRLGHPVVDRYLKFVQARARRNTLLAATSDLRVFFTEVDKEPVDMVPAELWFSSSRSVARVSTARSSDSSMARAG